MAVAGMGNGRWQGNLMRMGGRGWEFARPVSCTRGRELTIIFSGRGQAHRGVVGEVRTSRSVASEGRVPRGRKGSGAMG